MQNEERINGLENQFRALKRIVCLVCCLFFSGTQVGCEKVAQAVFGGIGSALRNESPKLQRNNISVNSSFKTDEAIHSSYDASSFEIDEAIHSSYDADGSGSNVRQNACQFDGLMLMWTGETQIVEGKMWYIMKCTKGHIFLAKNANH